MIKYLQLPFYFDAKKMQDEVHHLALNLWNLHFQTLHYEGDWSAIPLRNVDGSKNNIIIAHNSHEQYIDTPFLNECSYIKEIITNFKCPIHTVRLMKLNAGAVIKQHRDNELYFEKGEIRIHIPVVTHEDVEFYFDKEKVDMKEGECWYGNFSIPHNVINNSPVDRIHLVIDGIVNDWVKEVFESPEKKNKKETNKDYNVYESTNTPPENDNETTKKIIAELRNMKTAVGNKLADEMEAGLLKSDA